MNPAENLGCHSRVSVDFSSMAVNWLLIVVSSFLRASSVSRAPAAIQGRRIMTKTLQKHTESAQGNDEDIPSTMAWRSEAASLAFRLASSSLFFKSAAPFYTWRAMTSLTRWISCAATTSACSFAS
jgi:hypothetical protein